MRLVMIGTGNVATVLGRKILLSGHEVLQVAGRNAEHTGHLARILSCAHTTGWERIRTDADLYLIALSDSALLPLSESLRLPGRLVVHTAGALPQNILKEISGRYGVLYPLQSLRKDIGLIPSIPLLIDAGRPEDLEILDGFARTLSGQVRSADDRTRLKLHLAAVLVNNFTNHLYVQAELFCKREGLDFDLLLPLIGETAARLSEASPLQVQTGPAIRGDEPTIQKHLALLDNDRRLKELYQLFTDLIKDFSPNPQP